MLEPPLSATRSGFFTARWLASGLAALVSLCAAMTNAPSQARANPNGFAEETFEGNRWVYPQAAHDEIVALRVGSREAWRRITAELDLHGAPGLTIRVGRSPEEMRALASDVGALPAYASGVAFPDRSTIFLTLTAPDTWELVDAATVLAHEMSHVALHRAVNGNELPRWFTEGVAIDHAQERSLERFRTLWEGTVSGALIPLDGLSAHFPTQHHNVNLAYAQSSDFVRFLKRQPHGDLRFSRLLDAIADGTSFPEAILRAYHAPLPTLEREWREQLHLRFGRWPLLLSGLAGLWLILAVLLVVAYVRTRRRHHRTLARWAEEESRLDEIATTNVPNGVTTLSAPLAAASSTPHVRPDDLAALPPEPSGVPTIFYRGESHTLH